MPFITSRRRFLRDLGVSAAVAPFLGSLARFGLASEQGRRKQRLVVIFSPNGIVPQNFWPDEEGAQFALKSILQPLEPFKDRTLILHGVGDRVQGDGDNHMRGIGCLLTGIELFPGNVQGGSHTPAGWASGISIDQEIKNLQFGVMVPERADTWTRMSYAGPNKPLAPIDDPYQMFNKLYGQAKDRELLGSLFDDLQDDLKKVIAAVGADDRRLLEEQATFVRQMEQELQAAAQSKVIHAVPELQPGIREENDNIPQISTMQIDLLVNSFANDFARVATFQYTNSVGDAKMRWLGVEDGHHALSHEPDSNADAQTKLTKINTWYCEQLAHLSKRLAETPEPGGDGNLLDNTLIVWTNELGKGNSHTLNDIPFVLVGNGLGFQMGRSLKFKQTPHNRLLLALAHGFGHHIGSFGNPDFCSEGPLGLV